MKGVDTAERNRHYHCLEYDYDRSGDIFLIACGAERCDPGVRYGPDVREGYHLHMVLSGTGTLYAGNRTFRPRFGQLFLLKNQEVAEYVADASDPWRYCWVTYNGREAGRLSDEIGFTDGVYCLESEAEPKLFYEMVLRMYERPEMNYISDLYRCGILLEFLSLAMESVRGNAKRIRRPESPAKAYVDRAIQFIHYNYATIRVGDIVNYVGFTRSYFTSLFKKWTGQSPQEYLMQYRLKIACQQLTRTALPVQEIAAQVGYDNQMTFSKMFRNAYGISPTEYRQRGGTAVQEAIL
ncbi:MAG: AraC family transcriptional regulator [Oscillibacter sp.]|nr:AraC family transcriptional regulator [Oscillibacter sp.]